MLQKLLKELKRLVLVCNSYGIPLPLIRDPKLKCGSVSLTLVFISSVMVIVGLIGTWIGKLSVADMSPTLEFFYASSFLYFGRNWKTGGALKTDTEDGEPSKVEPPAK